MEALFLDGNVAVKSFCKALFTKLMDLMEALFLDGNVAVKSFCKALFTKSKGDDYIKVIVQILTNLWDFFLHIFLSLFFYQVTKSKKLSSK